VKLRRDASQFSQNQKQFLEFLDQFSRSIESFWRLTYKNYSADSHLTIKDIIRRKIRLIKLNYTNEYFHYGIVLYFAEICFIFDYITEIYSELLDIVFSVKQHLYLIQKYKKSSLGNKYLPFNEKLIKGFSS